MNTSAQCAARNRRRCTCPCPAFLPASSILIRFLSMATSTSTRFPTSSRNLPRNQVDWHQVDWHPSPPLQVSCQHFPSHSRAGSAPPDWPIEDAQPRESCACVPAHVRLSSRLSARRLCEEALRGGCQSSGNTPLLVHEDLLVSALLSAEAVELAVPGRPAVPPVVRHHALHAPAHGRVHSVATLANSCKQLRATAAAAASHCLRQL